MKLSALAAASQTSPASIKFYLREGLLAPGEKRNATTAVYGPAHLSRLELIAALRQIVGLSIEQIRTLTSRIDDPAVSLLDVMQTAQILASGLPAAPEAVAGPVPEAVAGPVPEASAGAAPEAVTGSAPEAVAKAEDAVQAMMAAAGWPDTPSAARQAAAQVIARMRTRGLPLSQAYLDAVAGALDAIAALDLQLSDLTADALPAGDHPADAPAETAADPEGADTDGASSLVTRDRIALRVAVGTFEYSQLVLAALRLGQASHAVRRHLDERA